MEGYDGGKGFVGGDPSGEKRKAIQYGAAWSGRCVGALSRCVALGWEAICCSWREICSSGVVL